MHNAEKDAARRHEHDVSCAFGNPQCPAFSEEPPRRVPWWRRLRETHVTPPGSTAQPDGAAGRP